MFRRPIRLILAAPNLQIASAYLQHGTSVRTIHNYVSSMILSFRKRRMLQEKKNPVPEPPSHRNTFLEWSYTAELFAFGKRLHENFDDSLLRQALTDKGFVVTERARQAVLGLDVESFQMSDNDYMAVEGRTIIRKYVRAVLVSEFPRFPKEGIDSVENFLVSDSVLANVASQIGMKDLIQCAEIPPAEETFARSFAALISVIDKSSGPDRTQRFVEDFVVTHLCDKNVNEIWDIPKPWSMLSDILSTKGETFEPRLLREAGKNTLLSVFVVGLYTPDKKLIATGIGETVEIAQEMAARDGLSKIFGTEYPRAGFKFLTERSFPLGSSTGNQLEASS